MGWEDFHRFEDAIAIPGEVVGPWFDLVLMLALVVLLEQQSFLLEVA